MFPQFWRRWVLRAQPENGGPPGIRRPIRSDVPLEVSKWLVNGYNPLIKGVYWGELSHLLTSDPNFLGHPSSGNHHFVLEVLSC